jgi:Tfp pilus assembly protein PilX
MGNLYKVARAGLKTGKHEKGMVLVIMMLFLAVISLLALNLLNTSLLEVKISSYYHNKVRAFYLAENYLTQYEQEILAGKKVSSAEVVDTSICGVTFYRVFAGAKYKEAPSNLHSTLVKIGDTTHCDPKPNIKPGRQAFWLWSRFLFGDIFSGLLVPLPQQSRYFSMPIFIG